MNHTRQERVDARRTVKALGATLIYVLGEYRVVFTTGRAAYYTREIGDAVATARASYDAKVQQRMMRYLTRKAA